MFNKIMKGLHAAVAYAKGDKTAARETTHCPKCGGELRKGYVYPCIPVTGYSLEAQSGCPMFPGGPSEHVREGK